MKRKTTSFPSSYKSGRLKVSGGHSLHYELYGNPQGVPVLFVHGGPGAGFSERDKRFFDRKRHRVIFLDQRGAGKSRPWASIKNNTTDKLVEDINRLLEKLKIEEITLFGGSWGSTLSLVYAIQNPHRVRAMVLRGIFLANKSSHRYFFGDIRYFAPQAWERFISFVPPDKRSQIPRYYLKRMLSKERRVSNLYCSEWARYELSLLRLRPSEEEVEKLLADAGHRPLAILEAYYLGNNCFLPENYILRNAPKIAHIPVSIVHGRYDLICPPEEAYLLHKKLPLSRLQYVVAGHSSREPEMERMLIRELKLQTKE